MAEQIINNGSSAGDPTAENIYTSFGKTKSNFSELYGFIPTLLAKAGGIMTGVLQFATGTAAAPSAKIGGDQKGFYEVGSNLLGVTVAGAKVGEFNSNGYMGLINRIILQDRKAASTNGGASISGNNDRDLNTVLVNNISGASLGTNQFTLPVGRYYINLIKAPCYAGDKHKAHLYNVSSSVIQTDINSNTIIGTSEYAYSVNSSSVINGYYFDVTTSPKTFKIVHYIETAHSTGLGLSGIDSNSNVYTIVDISKVG